MSKYRNNKILNWFQPGKWALWILLALMLKTGFFVFKINETTIFPNIVYTETFAREAGDCRSYIEPVETFIKSGRYYSDLGFYYIGTRYSFEDYRMPGYGIVYFFLRQFFDLTGALNAIVILQLVLAAVSVYVLALIALGLFKSKSSFYLVFILYLTSPVVSGFDSLLSTESFCISSMIFSLYFMVHPNSSHMNMFFSGLFMTWSIFLRPIVAPLLILFAIFVLLRKIWPRIRLQVTQAVLLLSFLSSFIIADGYWIYRNNKIHGGIHPLTTTMLYPGIDNSLLGSLYAFLQSYGGSIMGWKTNNEINYFVPNNKMTGIKFPDYIFNEKFNLDSLNLVRVLIAEIHNPVTTPEMKNQKIAIAKEKLDRYTRSIIEERPLLYHVTSRFIYLNEFLVQSGSGTLFEKPASQLSFPLLLIKMYCSFLYWFVLLTSLLGMVVLLVNGINQPAYVLLGLMTVYMLLVNPLILKLDDLRYFTPAYPLLVLCSAFILKKLLLLTNWSQSNKMLKPKYV